MIPIMWPVFMRKTGVGRVLRAGSVITGCKSELAICTFHNQGFNTLPQTDGVLKNPNRSIETVMFTPFSDNAKLNYVVKGLS